MILLRELDIHNFLSHEETHLQFREDAKVLIDGVSGSGKSSIVDAIIWAFYGVGRVDNKSLVRKGASEAHVRVLLQDGEKQYAINRKISAAGKHSIEVFELGEVWAPVMTAGTKETQKWIETSLLRCSYELFVNSVAYPQNNPESFVMASSVRRKELLLEIIGVEDIDAYYASARDLLTSREQENAALSGEETAVESIHVGLAELAKSIPQREKDLEEAVAKAEEAEAAAGAAMTVYLRASDGVTSFNSLSGEKKIVADKIVQIASLVAGYNTQAKGLQHYRPIESIRAEIAELSPQEEEYEALQNELNGAVAKNNERNALLANRPQEGGATDKLDFLTRQLARLDKESLHCPSGEDCPYQAKVAPERDSLIKEIEAASRAVENFDTELALWDSSYKALGEDPTPGITQRMNALRDSMLKLKNLRTELQTAEKKAETAKEVLNKIATAEVEIGSLMAREKEIDEKLVGLEEAAKDFDIARSLNDAAQRAQLDATRELAYAQTNLRVAQDGAAKLAESETRLTAIRTQKDALRVEISRLELVKDALSSTGIKALAVDWMIPRLEDKINEVLSQMSDFKVQLDTQKKSAKDTVIEGLFITIRNQAGEEFDFASYSGGEKLKITVAISEALASLQRVGFRILDELFVGLDEESTESFAYVLSSVQSRFKQMFCISHLRNIKDLFETKVTVLKIDNKSTVSYE